MAQVQTISLVYTTGFMTQKQIVLAILFRHFFFFIEKTSWDIGNELIDHLLEKKIYIDLFARYFFPDLDSSCSF